MDGYKPYMTGRRLVIADFLHVSAHVAQAMLEGSLYSEAMLLYYDHFGIHPDDRELIHQAALSFVSLPAVKQILDAARRLRS